jgi:hypothetical protein
VRILTRFLRRQQFACIRRAVIAGNSVASEPNDGVPSIPARRIPEQRGGQFRQEEVCSFRERQ